MNNPAEDHHHHHHRRGKPPRYVGDDAADQYRRTKGVNINISRGPSSGSINSQRTTSSRHHHHVNNVDRRELAARAKPILCYDVERLPQKLGGEELYESLPLAVSSGKARLVDEFDIGPSQARSWTVKAGHLWRIVCHKGPQIANMNMWSMKNPHEHFYSSKTREIHSTHVTTGDRLWSNMPFTRPLATITCDTIGYGWDRDGAGVHDVIGSRCDPYTHKLMTGKERHVCCHSSLAKECRKHGLTEMNVHDALSIFMCSGFTKDGNQYFTKPSPVQVGDYLEFLAETDLYISAATCVQGDGSVAFGDQSYTQPVVYPLKVEVYQMKKGFLHNAGWRPSEVSNYSRSHGMEQKKKKKNVDVLRSFSPGSFGNIPSSLSVPNTGTRASGGFFRGWG